MSKILIDRKLVEQALEALEGYRRELGDQQPCDAEQALEAALAEPVQDHFPDATKMVQEPLTDTYVQNVPDKCDRIVWRGQYFHLPVNSTSEPVQEPVAWRFEARHIDSAWAAAVTLKHPGPEGVYMRNVMPLYAHPPQRKPLTETSAERTLKRLGYTDCGGEFWKPPLGAPAQPVQEPVQDHFPDATKMVQEPVAQAIQDAVVYGVGISHGGKRIDPDSICKKAQPVQEPVACLIGTKGSAFDLPTTKRAYTYAKQPGNVVASRLGLACDAAASQSAGDSIDCGLGLLQELQRQGFGVFDLGAEYTAPPQRKPLTDEEIDGLMQSIGLRCADDGNERMANHAEWERRQRRRIARAIERAHEIGGEE